MQTSYNVIAYKDKPRLRTALEMLRTTQELENQLQEVWNSLLAFFLFMTMQQLRIHLSFAGFSTTSNSTWWSWYRNWSFGEQSFVWEGKQQGQEAVPLQRCISFSSWRWTWWDDISDSGWYNFLVGWALHQCRSFSINTSLRVTSPCT